MTYQKPIDLARALDCSRSTLSVLLRREDWPAATTPPWTTADVVKVQKWRAAELREDRAALSRDTSGPTVDLRRQKLTAEIRKITAMAERAESALERERGQFVDRQDVEAGRVSRIYDVKARMQELLNRAPEIANRPADEVRTIMEGWFREVCDTYAGGGGGD